MDASVQRGPLLHLSQFAYQCKEDTYVCPLTLGNITFHYITIMNVQTLAHWSLSPSDKFSVPAMC